MQYESATQSLGMVVTSRVHWAKTGNLEEVHRCLADGEMVDKRNTRRQTALHSACLGGHHEVADVLIKQ